MVKAVAGSARNPGKKRQSNLSNRPKVTFKRKSLESAFVHFVQLSCPESQTIEEVVDATKRYSAQEIEFRPNPEFEATTAERDLLGDCLLGFEADALKSKNLKPLNLPSHLARLCEANLLSPEEEKLLFQKMNFLRYRASLVRAELDCSNPDLWTIRRLEGLLKAADWYRDFIVKANMRLVISIVKKFVNHQNRFDDLLSDGIVALMRAVDKFDVGLGFRFSTYATQVVRRNSYRKVMEKQSERQRCALSIHDKGIDISDEQKESSMSEDRWNSLRSKLTTMLDHLDRREKLIIRARFSLGGHRRIQTLQRLADKLGVSKERIRQLEKRALDKLRGMTEVSPLPETDN